MKEIMLGSCRYEVQTKGDANGNTHKVLIMESIPNHEIIVLPLTLEAARELAAKLTSGIVMPTTVPGEAEALKDVSLKPPPARGGAKSNI